LYDLFSCVAAGVLLFCKSSASDFADYFWWQIKFKRGIFRIPNPRSSPDTLFQ